MENLTIVRESNYWGAGATLDEAKANFKKSSRKEASAAAVVTEYQGSKKDIERIIIDDWDGTITYPKTVIKIK